SIVTLSEQRGLATGIVSTARITHATPAAAYAHSADRNWENDGLVPPGQESCTDIASQLTAYSEGNGLDIVLGGGKVHFLPAALGGQRKDNRNLVEEWSAADPAHSTFVDTATDLENAAANLSAARGDKVFGLFSNSHMSYETERSKGTTTEPSLTEMTLAALRFLGASDKGYFLYVEAGRIDHAHHEGKAGRALVETIELSNAVAATLKSISLEDTLVLVTADHGHTMTIGGYPTRGNPILGYVTENDTHGQPKPEAAINTENRLYTTLSYANGPGFAAHQDPAVQEMDTSDPDYQQIAAYGLKWGESHSGADVVIYAAGPGADQFHGVIEQNRIFHLMQKAMQLYDRGDPDSSR
ncbi:MAG: alkaline phosphatase, partial [Gammaproteobacteria bacterium]|nr:alkaline phosphatase [Gammaproteobacteria bacterium]